MDFRQDPLFPQIVASLEESRGLPSGLLTSLISAESSGNPYAVSPAGARGLTQFMPAMVKQYNVNMADPVDQVRGGADYLQDLIHQYNGNVEAAVSHYNGGAANAQRYVDGTPTPTSKVSPENQKANQAYVTKVMSGVQQAPSVTVSDVRSMVDSAVKQGGSPATVIAKLLDNPVVGPILKEGLNSGDDPGTVLKNLGGDSAKALVDGYTKIGSSSPIVNAARGFGEGIADMGHGVSQLYSRVTGDDAGLAQKQAEEQARRLDPERQAVQDSTSGSVGDFAAKALPYIGAEAVTGGSALPLILGQAAAGAASGAATPTTGDGQILPNVLSGALTGAAVGVPVLGGKVLSKALSDAALPEARALMSRGALQASEQDGMRAISREALPRIGQTGDAITPEVISQARQTIYEKPNELMKSIRVAGSEDVQAPLSKIVGEYNKATPKPEVSPVVSGYVSDLTTKLDSGAMTGTDLMAYRRGVSDAAFNSTGTTKSALQDVVKVIDQKLQSVSPEASAALKTANSQWRHLQVLEKVIEKTKGQEGGMTAKNFANAVLQTNRDAFQAGVAPYQDLADIALKVHGDVPNSLAKGLAGAIHSNIDAAALPFALTHPGTLMAMGAKRGVSKLVDALASRAAPTVEQALAARQSSPLAMALTPTVNGTLSGSAAARAYIAKALGGSLNKDGT